MNITMLTLKTHWNPLNSIQLYDKQLQEALQDNLRGNDF